MENNFFKSFTGVRLKDFCRRFCNSFFMGGAGAGFFLLPPFFSLAEGGKPAKIWNMVS